MWAMQRFLLSFSVPSNPKRYCAFTLIELLIVIAIILILISIALPNFLEAQLRANVTKAKGDLHGLTTALEEYYQDFKAYPAQHDNRPGCSNGVGDRFDNGLYWLTSPIRYYSSGLRDPFRDRWTSSYHLNGIRKGPCESVNQWTLTWYLRSCGPDRDCYLVSPWSPMSGFYLSYCPTNGTVSEGDIFRFGGDPFWVGTSMSFANMVIYRKGEETGCSVDKSFYLDWVGYLHTFPPSLR